MRIRLLWVVALTAPIIAWLPVPNLAAREDDNAAAKAAIAKNAEAFVEAFHKGDAKALAAFWTPDGDYTDQTGHKMAGREAIEKTFEGLFAATKGLKVGIKSESLRFVNPDVAIEDGVTEVFPPDGAPPSRARYSIVHVKKDGQWLLSSVRDAMFTPPSNYNNLRGLEGAIGDWAGETENGAVERLSFVWAENQNFITGSFATTAKHFSLGSANVWIGWDPVAKNVRSWSFDAAGGFGEGAWTQDGNKWTVKSSSTLADAKKATATHIITLVDADTIAFQTKERSVDGQAMPDTKEVKLKRLKEDTSRP